jgi:hypothetical protein
MRLTFDGILCSRDDDVLTAICQLRGGEIHDRGLTLRLLEELAYDPV